MQVNGNGCEEFSSRHPALSARLTAVTTAPTNSPYTLPGTPTLLEEHSSLKSESEIMALFSHFWGAVEFLACF